MKELNVKNKFSHTLGPGGYKAAMPKWTKKEQELREAGILYPLEGCMVCTKNWILGCSRTDDSGRLITSSSEVTSVVEKARLSPLKRRLANSSRTRAISSIASWKEGFADESHLYKKHKMHEIAHNIQETFARQFFNLMRKLTICCADAYSRNQFGCRCHCSILWSEQCRLRS
jgi:hypothetical protein